jgi:hypothetical protein
MVNSVGGVGVDSGWQGTRYVSRSSFSETECDDRRDARDW